MSLVFDDVRAAVLFWATYAALTAVDARLVLRSLSGRELHGAPAPQGAVHRRTGLVVLLVGEGAGIAAAALDATMLPRRWPLLGAGLALAWAGIGLRLWAKRTLGRFFVGAVVIQNDHDVVTNGPYALIRHPGYAGAIVAMTGMGIATANALSMAVFTLVSLVVFTRTIAVEEATLAQQLGQPYVSYQSRTARLVPGIW
jgi:protein-S-isoprenylcysteine O-methyltransferase Ste14